MKRIAGIFLMVLFASWQLTLAQETESGVSFTETIYDFGELKKGDKAEHTFVFTNQTGGPVTLTRVKASCGCTTPSWTKEAIAPGQSGEIKVAYNTARVGAFTKTVTVNHDSSSSPTILYIKGNVQAEAAEEEDLYSIKQGNLFFDRVSQNVGTLDSDKTTTVAFQVKNKGPQPVKLTGTFSMEPMFLTEAKALELLPGQFTTLKFSVDGNKFVAPGAFSKPITIETDDPESPSKTLSISGNINKVYSEEELANQPDIKFDQQEYDAGKVLQGEKVQYAFTFVNQGKGELQLESVKASCGCTATAPKDKVLAPGQRSEIVATFDSRGRRGVQNKSITVRSNDPDEPVVVLRLKVEVEEDPFHIPSTGPAAGPGSQ